MAIFEKTIRNKNFDKLLRKLEREIPDSSWSANLEAGSDFKEGDARCSVRVFERYPDQLMIYAQRPDATACAEYDVWNNKMNRYVRRGSKGIALLDESGGYPRLHYVFDVSDTAPRRNALYPDLWQINESLKEPVRSMLAENYDVHSESFDQQLADVAGKLVQSYGWLSIMCKRLRRTFFTKENFMVHHFL